MAPSKSLVITIIVVSVVLFAAIITLVVLAAVKSKKGSKVKMYYRGQGVRMAGVKRRTNTSPTSWCIGSFDRVLPGSGSVVQGGTDVQTSQDVRPFISRGDPIKIGPQIFIVSTDLRRPFTPSTLPLDTSTNWISVTDGKMHHGPGKLVGPTNTQIIMYTCDTVQLPYNTWTGPRGGAIGYWDESGKWNPGNCPGQCPQWYSPLFLGPGGKQMNGPSPGTLAKVKRQTTRLSSGATAGAGSEDNGGDVLFYDKDPDIDNFLNTRPMPPPQPAFAVQPPPPPPMHMNMQVPHAPQHMQMQLPPPPMQPPMHMQMHMQQPPPPPPMHMQMNMQQPPPPPMHMPPPPPPAIPGFTKHLF